MWATKFSPETTYQTRAHPTVGRTPSGDTLARFSALRTARESQNGNLVADSDFEILCCRALGGISAPAAIHAESDPGVAKTIGTQRRKAEILL